MALAVDIDASKPAKAITIQLPISTEGEPPYKAPKTATAGMPEEMSSSSSDSGSSTAEDYEIGEKAQKDLHKHTAICESVMLIAGKSKASRVHMLGAEKTRTTGVLITWCGKKLSSYTSQ